MHFKAIVVFASNISPVTHKCFTSLYQAVTSLIPIDIHRRTLETKYRVHDNIELWASACDVTVVNPIFYMKECAFVVLVLYSHEDHILQ